MNSAVVESFNESNVSSNAGERNEMKKCRVIDVVLKPHTGRNYKIKEHDEEQSWTTHYRH